MNALSLRRIVVYLLAAVVVLGVGAWTVLGRGQAEGTPVELGVPSAGLEAVDQLSPSSGFTGGGADEAALTGDGAGATSTTVPIFVQVAGEVRHPGVYEVPAGSRVFEVLVRAGGVTPAGDEEVLPLAATVTDGARIVVPVKGLGAGAETGGAAAGGLTTPVVVPGGTQGLAGGAGAPGAGPVSLATATVEQLDALPGIGPSLAQQIIAYRESHGPYATVAELDDVPGIGPATMAKLEGLVVP